MVSLLPPLPALALRWSYFFVVSSVVTFAEFSPLYLKQLGFTASQVGLRSLMGIPLLFVPSFGLMGDAFRARKQVLVAMILAIVLMLLAPLLPLVSPLGSCNTIPQAPQMKKEKVYFNKQFHWNNSIHNVSKTFHGRDNSSSSSVIFNQTIDAFERNEQLSWSSPLFIYIIVVSAVFEALKRGIVVSYNVATMTYLKKDRTNYGSYFCWGHIGSSFSNVIVGIMAAKITFTFCGINIGYGYFVIFFMSAFFMCLSLPALPWIKYEYLDDRVINWADVRNIIFDCHYLIVFLVSFSIGCCSSFYQFWVNWYIAELSGSPVIMGIGGFTRRCLGAMWFFLSGRLVNKLGDMESMAVSLLLHVVSLLALYFNQNPWLVLVIDVCVTAAFSLSYSSLNIHFSKAASKASSSVILGKTITFVIALTLCYCRFNYAPLELSVWLSN